MLLSLLSAVGLPALAPNFSLFVSSFLSFSLLQLLSSRYSPRVFPALKTHSAHVRLNWDIHFVGWIHALIITPLSLYLILYPSPEFESLLHNPIYAYADREGKVFALSAGYFLVDFLQAAILVRTHGVQYLLHACACGFIFWKSFSPFLMGVGAKFLIWETSTIFLHIHWALDKLYLTGSAAQLINGFFLVSSFFICRIVFGAYNTVELWNLLEQQNVKEGLSISAKWGIRSANLALMGLNVLWFGLMIKALNNRFGGNDAGGKEGLKQVELEEVDCVEEKEKDD